MTAEPKKKRRKGKSPSAQTLAECRKRGWIAQSVEQRIPKSFITRDLFGVIDIVAITPGGILGIQATGGRHNAARRDKILAEPRALAWLRAGAALAVWNWEKQGPRGKRKVWTLREVPILCVDFEPDSAPAPSSLHVQVLEEFERGLERAA